VVTRPVRIGLANLGVIQGAIALWALFAPRAFYDDFPVPGAHWVSALPPFNEHLIRDYGASFLAISALALAAAWIAERRLAVIALVVWLVAAVPHLVFHLAHSDDPSGIGGASSLVTLAFNVALPLALLFLVRKENLPHAPHRPGAR
jgi:hypothetical protein